MIAAVIGPTPLSSVSLVPHASMADRLFVLAPLAELVPRLVPPGWHETVATAARRRAQVEGPGAVRVLGTWAGDRWLP